VFKAEGSAENRHTNFASLLLGRRKNESRFGTKTLIGRALTRGAAEL